MEPNAPLEPEKEPENPWWGRLFGWPLVIAVLVLLLGAPLAVKLSVWLSK